jgi:hypothetical protein
MFRGMFGGTFATEPKHSAAEKVPVSWGSTKNTPWIDWVTANIQAAESELPNTVS